MAKKITNTNVATKRCETLDIRPTSDWVIIPVTAPNGRAGFIRRQLWMSDEGRLFVLNGTSFDEVRQDALGAYRMIGVRFMEGEWHYDDNGVLVAGPEPAKKEPIWVVPNVPTKAKQDDCWMSFC